MENTIRSFCDAWLIDGQHKHALNCWLRRKTNLDQFRSCVCEWVGGWCHQHTTTSIKQTNKQRKDCFVSNHIVSCCHITTTNKDDIFYIDQNSRRCKFPGAETKVEFFLSLSRSLSLTLGNGKLLSCVKTIRIIIYNNPNHNKKINVENDDDRNR